MVDLFNYEHFAQTESLLAEVAALLCTDPRSILVAIERLQSRLRDQREEIERLNLKLAQGA